jgi:hypothetical protein
MLFIFLNRKGHKKEVAFKVASELVMRNINGMSFQNQSDSLLGELSVISSIFNENPYDINYKSF